MRTAHFESCITTDFKSEMLSGIKTGNRITYEEFNVSAILYICIHTETQTCKQEYASAGVTLAWAGSFFMYLILFHHFLEGENIFDA